ncbi:MAG: hypothetical protein M3014_00950 [Chloroflexota bacterium]|nr:hypothetical protein [Chloroflexota bacterium]
MNSSSVTQEQIKIESVVELARQVLGTHAQDGSLVARENLGPGVVRGFGEDGSIRVYWPCAELHTWVTPEEIDQESPRARLIVRYRCDKDGHLTFEECKVVANMGLTHNWRVEILQGGVVRTVRSDGLAWAFDRHPVFERTHPLHAILDEPLAEEDHDEALSVAGLNYLRCVVPLVRSGVAVMPVSAQQAGDERRQVTSPQHSNISAAAYQEVTT